VTRNESNVAADAKVEALLLLLLLLLLILLLVEETEEDEDDEDEDEDDEEIEAREDCPFGSFRCNFRVRGDGDMGVDPGRIK
tara:strand:+ start:1066 stop:1311 length:246 start_codon:yes stop_codon:yes gene_type:complete